MAGAFPVMEGALPVMEGALAVMAGALPVMAGALAVMAGALFLLWQVLFLPTELREELVVTPIIKSVLDLKLTQPRALLVIVFDGVALLLLLLCFSLFVYASLVQQRSPRSPAELGLLLATLLLDLRALFRVLTQLISMKKMADAEITSVTLLGWLADGWNMLDICVVVGVATECLMTVTQTHEGSEQSAVSGEW